jgi:hypothetical protein
MMVAVQKIEGVIGNVTLFTLPSVMLMLYTGTKVVVMSLKVIVDIVGLADTPIVQLSLSVVVNGGHDIVVDVGKVKGGGTRTQGASHPSVGMAGVSGPQIVGSI